MIGGQAKGRGELITYNALVSDRLEVVRRETVDVIIDTVAFGRGGVREAFHLTLPGISAKRLVAKRYSWKESSAFEQNYLEDFICYNISARYAKSFNEQSPPNLVEYTAFHKVLHFNGTSYALEDMLEGEFSKHNNIFGWLESNRRTPQAFTHFTYAASAGQEMVLDVQGVTAPDGSYKFTDPAVVSLDGRYGYTDPGVKSIYEFFKVHECSDVCRAIGLPPVALEDVGRVVPFARNMIRESRNTAAHQPYCASSGATAPPPPPMPAYSAVPARLSPSSAPPPSSGGLSVAAAAGYSAAAAAAGGHAALPHSSDHKSSAAAVAYSTPAPLLQSATPAPPQPPAPPVGLRTNPTMSAVVRSGPAPPQSSGVTPEGGLWETAPVAAPAPTAALAVPRKDVTNAPLSVAQSGRHGDHSHHAHGRARRGDRGDDPRETLRQLERMVEDGSVPRAEVSRRIEELRRRQDDLHRRSTTRRVEDVIVPALTSAVMDRSFVPAQQITFDFKTKKWDANVIVVQISVSPFVTTAAHEVFKAKNLAAAWPKVDSVAKRRRSGDDVRRFFERVEDNATCGYFASEFNRQGVPKHIDFLSTSLIDIPSSRGGADPRARYLLTPFLDGYIDTHCVLNRSSRDDRNTPQAFSHFTYAHSDGRLLIATLKGSGDRYISGEVYLASSPSGRSSIDSFFRSHSCNSICRGLQLPSKDAIDAAAAAAEHESG